MQTKSLVVATALVLALAAAAPTIGKSQNKGALADQALEISKEAREIAKSAKRGANRARGIANSAVATANAANSTASSASTKADSAASAASAAGDKADAAATAATGASAKADAVAAELSTLKSKSAQANGIVTTADETDYQNLGGPSVTLTVPASGLIEVWAQASVEEGAIALFEDGVQVPDLDPNDFCEGPAGALLAVPGAGPGALVVGTPAAASFAGICGQTGSPSPVLVTTSPGEHTYSLRYADCGCDPGVDGTFSGRFLAVAPRP